MLAHKSYPENELYRAFYKAAGKKAPYWTKKRVVFLLLIAYAVTISITLPLLMAELFFQ